MQPIKLKEADTKHIQTIAELAKITWNQHYSSIISQAQIQYMLDKMYSQESLNEQILVKKHRFFIIESFEKAIGFISLYKEQDRDWFLSKFYINQLHSRQGYGTLVFNEIVQLTEAKKIKLTVNRQNFKAINFYFKLGFFIETVADFDIGGGYEMNDFVMIWKKGN